jgi:hypothetical protein
MQRDSHRLRIEYQYKQLSLILRVYFRRWSLGLPYWGIRNVRALREEIDLQNLYRSRVLSVRFDIHKVSDQQALV